MKTIRMALFFALLLTGLSAGMGFANAVGYMPAFSDTPAESMIPFWQNADKYFRVRMPVFGNLLLLTLVITMVLLRQHWRTASFWLVAAGLLFALGDLTVILTENRPVNLVLETWTTGQVPPDYAQYQQRATEAFAKRSTFTIASFVCVLLATFLWPNDKPFTGPLPASRN